MADIRDVDDWVDVAAGLPIETFYPSAVAKATGIPLPAVFERLLFLARDERIILRYQVRCPSYDCVRTIETLDRFPDNVPLMGKCDVCGEEFEVRFDMIFPVFGFTPEYRERIRSKKKLQTRLVKYPEEKFYPASGHLLLR